MKRDVRVLLVTDPRWSEAHIASVALSAAQVLGARFGVQLRDRSARTDEDLLPFAARLRELTARHGAVFVVNRRQDLARRAGADGLHAPVVEGEAAGGGMPWGWRSAPAHSNEDVQNACIAGVDAVLVSPVFATPGKGTPRGVGALREARRIADAAGGGLGVFALGGVDVSNAAECHAAGASGVAVIRALLEVESAGAVPQAALALAGAFGVR